MAGPGYFLMKRKDLSLGRNLAFEDAKENLTLVTILASGQARDRLHTSVAST